MTVVYARSPLTADCTSPGTTGPSAAHSAASTCPSSSPKARRSPGCFEPRLVDTPSCYDSCRNAHLKFDLSTTSTGAVFFAAGTLSAFSQFLAPRLAGRIGLIRTMVYTHLPANVFLVLAAVAPSPGTAIALLMMRALLSQMDVPARQAFVMAAVLPEERAAAASVTNVPRSLASAATPAAAGWLLANGHLAAPLVIAGSTKAAYDLLLLWRFHAVAPDNG